MARIRKLRRRYKRRVVRKFKRYMRRGNKLGWRSKRTGKKRLTGGLRNKRRVVFYYSTRFEASLPSPSGGLGASGQIAFTVQGNSLTDIVNYITGITNPTTQGAEQPQEFDQWANFYRLYRVLSCALELEIMPLTPADPALGPIEILIFPVFGPDNSTIANEPFSVTAARPYCKTRIFNVGSDTKVLRFKHFARTKTITYSNGNEVYEDDEYAGTLPTISPPTSSVAPPIQWGFIVKAQYMRFAGTAQTGADFLIRMNTKHYTQMEWRVFNGPSGAVN